MSLVYCKMLGKGLAMSPGARKYRGITMGEYAKAINQHYGQDNLFDKILARCREAGLDPDALTRESLASFDEFHIRGLEATRELAKVAELRPGMKVLDVGCGVGGPARTIAAEYDCAVTGLDIVEEYVRTAGLLTQRVGLESGVQFKCGDATAMPFADGTFHCVLSQHAMMNIENKDALFREIRRVLRPSGRIALHEVCAGPASPPHLPVPWASDSSINFLLTPEELRSQLPPLGYGEVFWRDVSARSLQWFRVLLAATKGRSPDRPPPLGLDVLMGESMVQKAANVLQNLEERRIRVIQGVWEVPA